MAMSTYLCAGKQKISPKIYLAITAYFEADVCRTWIMFNFGKLLDKIFG